MVCRVVLFRVCGFYLIVCVVLDSVLPLYDHAITFKDLAFPTSYLGREYIA